MLRDLALAAAPGATPVALSGRMKSEVQRWGTIIQAAEQYAD